MKYVILKPFRDKITNEKYEPGQIVKFTKKRAKEILKVDLLIEEYQETTK